jgi:hypothetical protein
MQDRQQIADVGVRAADGGRNAQRKRGALVGAPLRDAMPG